MVFTDMLNNLVQLEFFQLLFPFLLALAIVYGVLMYAAREQLGKGPISLISVVIAFFVMLYSSWSGSILYTFLTTTSGVFLTIASALLFLIVILGLMGLKISNLWGKDRNWIMVVIALIVLYIFLVGIWGATPFGLPWWSFQFNSDFWTVIFFIVVLAIVLWALGREGGAAPTEKKES